MSETRFRGEGIEGELSLLEKELGSMDDDGASVWITVDCGAPENVASEPCFPHTPTYPSKGSVEGVRYVAVNCNSTPNRGGERRYAS